MVLNFAYLHHVYCREELFDSLKSAEGTIHLLDILSYAIKNVGIISLSTHDGVVGKLGDVNTYQVLGVI